MRFNSRIHKSFMRVPCCGLAALIIAAGAIAPVQSLGQCEGQWAQGVGLPGTDSQVHVAIPWDPDGAGPADPLVVFGGSFRVTGNKRADLIAALDSFGNFHQLAYGFSNGTAYALIGMPNGDLVVGGQFFSANQVFVSNIVRFNGASWSPLGAGLGTNAERVRALTLLPNGDLIAAGTFTNSGTLPLAGFARWDGTTWSSFGAELGPSASVQSLVVMLNGDLIAGGSFTVANGAPGNNIARWNGTNWSPLGSGTNGSVTTMTVRPNGDLIVAGSFTSAGGVTTGIARWNGANWSAVGTPGANSMVITLTSSSNGDLIACGNFSSISGVSANRIARWNGTAWSAFGSGTNGSVSAAVNLPSGDLVVAGFFSVAGSLSVKNLARWDGAEWRRLGQGFNDTVYSIAVRSDESIVAGGAFTTSPHSGSTFRIYDSAGPNFGPGLNNVVRAVTIMPNGEVVAAGSFTATADNAISLQRIARWNGTSWSGIGGINGTVYALLPTSSGGLYAGGLFANAGGVAANNIAYWDGANWHALGTGTNNTVLVIASLPGGDIAVGGSFTSAGGLTANRIARWNGLNWSPMGAGVNDTVFAIAAAVNGEVTGDNGIYVAGSFTNASGIPANRIARWDGEAWTSLGNGLDPTAVYALAPSPNGDIYAGGQFLGAYNRLTRWDGQSWSSVGSGVNNSFDLGATAVQTLNLRPSGELLAGGLFSFCMGAYPWAGDQASSFLGRWMVPTGLTPPEISAQPASASIFAGQSASLSVSAVAGSPPLGFHWQRNLSREFWRDLDDSTILGVGEYIGAYTPTLTIQNAGINATNRYRCVVFNACAAVYSQPARLCVMAGPACDINGDGTSNGRDIQTFVGLLGLPGPVTATWCAADLDGNGLIDAGDVAQFVAFLLAD